MRKKRLLPTILAFFCCHVLCLSGQTEKGAAPLAPSTLPTGQAGVNHPPSTVRAVVVGISDYQDEDIPDLRFADRDAEAFANFLRSPAGGSLDGDHLKVLLNSQATVAQFAIALDWLMENSKEGDQAIIYFSGHGDVEKKTLTQPGFLLCWDAPARVYMAGGAFALPMLQEVISTLSIQNKAKVVVVTDACRSGTLAGQSIGGAQATAANLAKQYANEIKILSCQPNEHSIEGEQWGGGRGAFSFNLVDALYGFADGNNDLFVTLQEVGRYLEDHVTAEVAPVSQVPMVIGNRTERLAAVDAQILADLKTGRTSQMKLLSPVESRGIEDDVLAAVDTTTRELYRLFKKALKDKVFLEPATACADAYYKKLIAEPKLARLHSTMTRNFAAALQDEVQQELNFMLKTGLNKEVTFGKRAKDLYKDYPAHLERAAELLGPEHYMYPELKARQLFFEGKMKGKREEKRQAFFQALEWQPNLPHVWLELGITYNTDSCVLYMNKAMELAPTWITPYLVLARRYQFSDFKQFESLIDKADQIDSNSIVIWYLKAGFYAYDRRNSEKAEKYYLKVIEESTASEICFPCAHYNLALLYFNHEQYSKAEHELQKTLQIDPSLTDANCAPCFYSTLSKVYVKTGNLKKAEETLHLIIALDSMHVDANLTLWKLLMQQAPTAEVDKQFDKLLILAEKSPRINYFIGEYYYSIGKHESADTFFQKYLLPTKGLDKIRTGQSISWFYLIHGEFEKSKQLLNEMIAFSKRENVPFYNTYYDLAWVHFSFGEKQEAINILKELLEGRGVMHEECMGHLLMFSRLAGKPETTKAYFEEYAVKRNRNIMKVWDCFELFNTDQHEKIETAYSSIMNGTYEWWVIRYLRLGYVWYKIQNGNYQEAIDIMDDCQMDHYTFNYLLLTNDPHFAPLRVLPEWAALIKKYFPDQVKD